MKNKLLIILFLFVLSSSASSQDLLGGEISAQYINGGPMEIHVRLYTDVSYGLDRPNINLHVGDLYYQAIPKIFDTIVAPGVRYSYYKGISTLISSGGGMIYVYDTIPISRFKNVNLSNDSLTRIEFLSEYLDIMNIPQYSNDMPLCSDNFLSVEANAGTIEHQIDCIDPNDDSLVYFISNDVGGMILNQYSLPSGVSISPSGLFTWDAPSEIGLYLFSIGIKDMHSMPSTTNRLFFIKVDSSMILTPTTWVENNNHLQVFPNPTTDQLTVKFDYFTPDNTQIQIFDITGRMVHQQAMIRQNHQIQMRDFPSGVYVVSVRSGDKVVTRKVVKN